MAELDAVAVGGGLVGQSGEAVAPVAGEAGEPVGDFHHPVALGVAEVGGQVDPGVGGPADQPVEQDGARAEGHHPAGGGQQLQVPDLLVVPEQHHPDGAVRAEPVGEGDGEHLVSGVGEQGTQVGVGVVHAGGVHLAGAEGEFLHPGQVRLVGGLDLHDQVEGAQELLVGAGERLAFGGAAEAGLVHVAAAGRVDGDDGGAELGEAGQLGRPVRVVAADLGVVVGDFGPLGRLVVDEGDRLHREVQLVGDLLDRLRLGVPADLRQHEVLGDAEGLQPCPGVVVVVLAGHGLEDAAGVEFDDGAADLVGQHDLGVLQQGAPPQGVVEVPDQALHEGGSVGHGSLLLGVCCIVVRMAVVRQMVSRACRARISWEISVVPSISSMALASR